MSHISTYQTHGSHHGLRPGFTGKLPICGLCVRYCAEVKQKNAVGFVDRGIRKEISFIPEIAARECNDCKACFPLCPTSYLQAVFVLTESLAFPDQRHEVWDRGARDLE